MQATTSRLFGVLGDPIDHSRSPVMHNAAFAATNLPHLYLRFRVPPADLPAALHECEHLAVGGLNLTVPLKEHVLPLVDELTPAARRIGAANTLIRRGRRWIGDNTDGSGFVRALPAGVTLCDARVVVIGAGGSARAVGDALVEAGVRSLTFANRTVAKAEAVAAAVAPRVGTIAPLDALAQGDVLADTALVVNTTPLSLHGDVLPVRWGASPRDCVFVDLAYGSRPTPFIAAARRAGRHALDGMGMLLHQGALAFERWTGRRAPVAVMAAALGYHPTPLRRMFHVGTSKVPRPRTT